MQKMKTKIFPALICFTFSFQALATDYLMLIGAGGEDAKKETTIFDNTIQNMAKYVERTPGLKVNVALNGGHAKTEEIINKSFPNAETKTSFQAADYKRLIQNYKTKLENNEMVSGDQLMIFIDTHGAQKQKSFKTHAISTSGGSATDFNTLSGSSNVDLDQLEVLKKLAKDKGVKLAIIDASCHSGNTQSLADDNTCVISGTGPNHYGYTTFSQDFSAAMSKGKNLEEIFLKVRKQDTTPGLPMISTQAGQEVTSLLYDKITPFVYYFDAKNDKLTPYLKKTQDEEVQCLSNYNTLISTINEIEELNTVSKKVLFWNVKKKKVKLKNLKKLLESYENSMVSIQQQMKAVGANRLNQKETFKTPTQSVEYSWKELLTTDFNPLINDMKGRLQTEQLESNRTLLKDLITVYERASARKEELLKTQPDLREIPAKEAEIKRSIDANYFTAAAIGTEERKLYSALYKTDDKPNPCKDFKL
jgi:hypothetical protein